ncbi:nucleoside recognition domain-containing protein [Geofilum rubicundum]|uniref:Fused spore maturation proteins A and B n=1 Tax=Geofilum rubicundum JCM 15548 TaxID=1236989 RepID=A0A0E9LTH0_9BACT|nr:spore maturation protein [Geofilum rubicundum]GAO28426.1 Fused spore maturation proteins A and B [Geofilum rubicundum JCM 15548]
MVLNYIWIAFFLIAFVVALIRLLFFQDMEIFSELVNSTFESASTGFTISLGLTGVLTLWLGFMKIAEKGGMVTLMTRAIGPFFNRLFPTLPKNHPAYGSMMMNLAANMLGLDNAATPMGLKAMKEMQTVNDQKDTASNAQIMFLVLNTSGLTIIPVSIMVYRAQFNAANPADIFLPILLATFFSTIAGVISVAVVQRIKLLDPVIMAYLGGMTALVGALLWGLSRLDREQLRVVSLLIANLTLFSFIIVFIVRAVLKKVNVYEAFIEGGKEGFSIAIKIIPYLIAILVSIGVFRASGAMDYLIDGVAWFFTQLNVDTRFVDALPTALMKPLSGSGARGMMIDTMNAHGVDSFAGRLASTVQGATDTTFYIIAVYFGSVGIRNTRHAVPCGLIADFTGIIAAIFIGYLFFG